MTYFKRNGVNVISVKRGKSLQRLTFCLFGLKDNHHAIFFAPLSFLRRYLVVVPSLVTVLGLTHLNLLLNGYVIITPAYDLKLLVFSH